MIIKIIVEEVLIIIIIMGGDLGETGGRTVPQNLKL